MLRENCRMKAPCLVHGVARLHVFLTCRLPKVFPVSTVSLFLVTLSPTPPQSLSHSWRRRRRRRWPRVAEGELRRELARPATRRTPATRNDLIGSTASSPSLPISTYRARGAETGKLLVDQLIASL